MEIKQLEPKDKVITFFGEIKSASIENTIKEITRINLTDQNDLDQCRQWATDNDQEPAPAKLTPIRLILSTSGGPCYDGFALHDAIEASQTPIEVICTGRVMSMGIIVLLGADIRHNTNQLSKS